jgi:hypothetical protein
MRAMSGVSPGLICSPTDVSHFPGWISFVLALFCKNNSPLIEKVKMNHGMKKHALPIVAYASKRFAGCIPLFIDDREPFFGI